jgi:hypothetical protein
VLSNAARHAISAKPVSGPRDEAGENWAIPEPWLQDYFRVADFPLLIAASRYQITCAGRPLRNVGIDRLRDPRYNLTDMDSQKT